MHKFVKKPCDLTDAELQVEWEALTRTETVRMLNEQQVKRLNALEKEITERHRG